VGFGFRGCGRGGVDSECQIGVWLQITMIEMMCLYICISVFNNHVRIPSITIDIPTLYLLICVHYDRSTHSFEVHVEVS